MMDQELKDLIAKAKAAYDTMTPEQKKAHDDAQRASFVRSIVDWPKPNYHWENGVKVYHSYEDYCND